MALEIASLAPDISLWEMPAGSLGIISIIQSKNMLFVLPKKFFLILIRTYQKTLSFDHGPLKFFRPCGQCKYYPSCSEYALQAINKYGVLKGFYKAFKRLMHCHPWSQGGYDPV